MFKTDKGLKPGAWHPAAAENDILIICGSSCGDAGPLLWCNHSGRQAEGR